MNPLPETLFAQLPVDAQPVVQQWWHTLTADEQADVQTLWETQRETIFFAPQADDDGHLDSWDQVPDVEGGRFIPHDDSIRMHDWLEDWQRYLLGHEEVFLLSRAALVFRTGGICQREPAAQAVLVSGVLPTTFACSANAVACPMHQLQQIAPGETMCLGKAKAGGWWVVARRTKTKTRCEST